jgi:hypothetical protein
MKSKLDLLNLSLALALAPSIATAKLCEKWEEPTVLGHLDTKYLNEASGLSVSRIDKKLYLINDSGSAPEFFVSDRNGDGAKKVSVSDFKLEDTEDLALGPCVMSDKRCVILADIGDNDKKRSNIKVIFVEEVNPFPAAVKPLGTRYFKYPHKPHNAEAMAVLPNGDLIVITKESKMAKGKPSEIFRAHKSEYEKKSNGEVTTLDKIGEIDANKIAQDKFLGGVVTGMSVTSDGKKFVLLTYGAIIEFDVDLSAEKLDWKNWKKDVDYKVLSAPPLAQQESIAYDADEKSVLYTTEMANFGLGSRQSVPIMRIGCVK